MSSKDLTRRLCTRIVETTSESLGESQLAAARELVLDGICVAVAGAATEEGPSILARHFREQGGKPAASVIGMNMRLPAPQAALLNAASMHVLDYEPMWTPGTHALSPALSAALAVAEDSSTSGLTLCTAVIKGIEIQGWLRQAGVTESRELRFHPPGFVGPFGSVVAVAHILDLDAASLANALGIAASRCGGLFSNLGTMTKSAHCGYAAQSGVEAVQLSRRGFTASESVFDSGKQGYAQAFMPESFNPDMLLNFGRLPFRVVDPGYAIKMFPAKFSTHYGILAALALHRQLSHPAQIQSIRITAADVPSSNRPFPSTGLDGKFSVQYTVAAALLDGKVDLDTFNDERLRAPDIQDMLSKTTASFSSEIPSLYATGRYTEVEIGLEDGQTLKERCTYPPGSWKGEPLSRTQHRAKAIACLRQFLGSAEANEVIDLCDELDSLPPAQLRRLIGLVTAKIELQD